MKLLTRFNARLKVGIIDEFLGERETRWQGGDETGESGRFVPGWRNYSTE